jgi:Ring finger domain
MIIDSKAMKFKNCHPLQSKKNINKVPSVVKVPSSAPYERCRRMDPINLQEDICEFLEEKSRQSQKFMRILDHSGLFLELPLKFPRASSKAIASLPFCRVYPFDKIQHSTRNDICNICRERLIDGVALSRMPCGHVYHLNCIVHWLGTSCACPECRYEIETIDPRFEIGRRQRMRERDTYTCTCSSNMSHQCFFPRESVSHHNTVSYTAVKVHDRELVRNTH